LQAPVNATIARLITHLSRRQTHVADIRQIARKFSD
jgi:hypothetical protein